MSGVTASIQHLEDNSIPEPNSGCRLWLGRLWANGRYGALSVRVAGRLETYSAHRLAFELAKGPIPEGLCVCHRCDVTHCVNPDHLFLGTRKENTADMARKGRAKFVKGSPRVGTRNGRALLSPEQVLAIRTDRRPPEQIAAGYGISKGNVNNIRYGRTWRHLFS